MSAPPTYVGCHGAFHHMPEVRALARHLPSASPWTIVDRVPEPQPDDDTTPTQQFGPPGTLLLEYDGEDDHTGFFTITRARSIRPYLFVHPDLGIALATLGFITEDGIEVEDALSEAATRWLIQSLFPPSTPRRARA